MDYFVLSLWIILKIILQILFLHMFYFPDRVGGGGQLLVPDSASTQLNLDSIIQLQPHQEQLTQAQLSQFQQAQLSQREWPGDDLLPYGALRVAEEGVDQIRSSGTDTEDHEDLQAIVTVVKHPQSS